MEISFLRTRYDLDELSRRNWNNRRASKHMPVSAAHHTSSTCLYARAATEELQHAWNGMTGSEPWTLMQRGHCQRAGRLTEWRFQHYGGCVQGGKLTAMSLISSPYSWHHDTCILWLRLSDFFLLNWGVSGKCCGSASRRPPVKGLGRTVGDLFIRHCIYSTRRQQRILKQLLM